MGRLHSRTVRSDQANGAVGRKYGVSDGAVWYIRNKAGLRSTATPGVRKAVSVRAMVPARPKHAEGVQSVQIEPRRPGTASALIDALDKVDGEKLQIELTMGEVAQIVGRMDAARRNAFISAGLRAVLLGYVSGLGG